MRPSIQTLIGVEWRAGRPQDSLYPDALLKSARFVVQHGAPGGGGMVDSQFAVFGVPDFADVGPTFGAKPACVTAREVGVSGRDLADGVVYLFDALVRVHKDLERAVRAAEGALGGDPGTPEYVGASKVVIELRGLYGSFDRLPLPVRNRDGSVAQPVQFYRSFRPV